LSQPETVYHCDCEDCDRVVPVRRDPDELVIKVRHDGQTHETRIPVGILTPSKKRAH